MSDLNLKSQTELNSGSSTEKLENSFLSEPKEASLGPTSGNLIREDTSTPSSSTIIAEEDGIPTLEELKFKLDLAPLGYVKDVKTLEKKKSTRPVKEDLYTKLLKRITTREDPDFTVLIGEEEIKCHLIVLQCYSIIFHNYKITETARIPSEKCSASSFALIYQWMIDDYQPYRILTHFNVIDIFKAAQYLKIKALEKHCLAFIDNTKIFNEDTAFHLYIQAKQSNLKELQEKMVPRIQNFFLILVSSWDWLELDCEDITTFLSSNWVKINCEMEIFMAAVRWLYHDWDNRKDLKLRVLNCVRFGNMTSRQLVDIKLNPENPVFNELAEDPDIYKLIDAGLAVASLREFSGEVEDSVLGLEKPMGRNWTGLEKTYTTYHEFVMYLEYIRRRKMLERIMPTTSCEKML